MKKFMLVYQAGIANLFEVQEQFAVHDEKLTRVRVYQGDFRTAEAMAQGCVLAGASVRSAACNEAGDIASSNWTWNLEDAPFSDKFRPVGLVSANVKI
jgi:hypothetical protein